MIVGQQITVGGKDNTGSHAARPPIGTERSDMSDGRADALECLRDPRGIRIERIVLDVELGLRKVKWHGGHVVYAALPPTRPNGECELPSPLIPPYGEG